MCRRSVKVRHGGLSATQPRGVDQLVSSTEKKIPQKHNSEAHFAALRVKPN